MWELDLWVPKQWRLRSGLQWQGLLPAAVEWQYWQLVASLEYPSCGCSCQHHELLTKRFYIHSSCRHELGRNPGLSPVAFAVVLAEIKELWCSGKKSKLQKREHCCLSEGKPMLKEGHPCSKSFVRQVSATILYALGILWVILGSRSLFPGMLPHQVAQGRGLQEGALKLLCTDYAWAWPPGWPWVQMSLSLEGSYCLFTFITDSCSLLQVWYPGLIFWPNSNYNPYRLLDSK